MFYIEGLTKGFLAHGNVTR